MEKKTPEALYLRLGQLLASPPDLGIRGPIDPESLSWVARVGILVREISPADASKYDVAAEFLTNSALREMNKGAVMMIAHRALAMAEDLAPAVAKGAFLGVGDQFDVYKALEGILGSAQENILIVDPYLDGSVLSKYGALVQEGVNLQLLGMQGNERWSNTLVTAVEAWSTQYGALRPVEYRLGPRGELHDRMVLIDGGRRGWNAGQSIKDLATKSPTAFSEYADTLCAEKWSWYQALWTRATVVR